MDTTVRRALAIGMMVLLAACSGPSVSTSIVRRPSTTVPPTSTTTSTVSAALSPQEVFETVSPALAYIETDLGSGSGVLFDEWHLVTNAHVVWPYDDVRVVFPDGTELLDADVTHIDEIADLAIVDVSRAAPRLPEPVTLGDPDGLAVGGELYLIGYPGEVEEYPQPTLTRGILSRVRTIDALGLEFLQTDAVIAGGQSGGALVDDNGTVIGISGLGSEGFALAASAADVRERLADMLAGRDTDGIADRSFPGGPGELSYTGPIEHYFVEKTWVVDMLAGEELQVEATSDGDVYVALTAFDGFLEGEADEGETGTESLTVVAPFDGPYFLTLDSFAPVPIDVTLTSNLPLRPLSDPDDETVVVPGQTVVGYADYPGDIDTYRIDLSAGDRITVTVSAVLMDPEIIIDLEGNEADFLGRDDSSGGGLFGTDARLSFRADTDATYFLVVVDEFYGPGGYVMTIER
ncbi:MAG: serine protease [Acidimicrobiia bacterium]|nr:serine protease [Acidimicrobiia bacterium]